MAETPKYKIVTVTINGRNYHQRFDNMDSVFRAYEEKKRAPKVLHVSLFRDNTLVLAFTSQALGVED